VTFPLPQGVLVTCSYKRLNSCLLIDNTATAPGTPEPGVCHPRTPLSRHHFDWLSALLSAVTFSALIIGIDNLRRLSLAFAFELACAAVAGALFVWRQRMLADPMLALELFARPVFALSVVGSICSFTAQNLTFVSLPFFLEEVLGRSAVETGLLMTHWPMAVGFTAPIAGWLVDKRYPAGILGGLVWPD